MNLKTELVGKGGDIILETIFMLNLQFWPFFFFFYWAEPRPAVTSAGVATVTNTRATSSTGESTSRTATMAVSSRN